jgi:ferrochelatase
MSKSYDAVLLIAFGGPTCAEEIRPFLARVTQGLPIPPQRLEEVAHHYKTVGGKSPLSEITFRQANALQNALNQHLPVYFGMRNSAPFFADTLKQMTAAGVTRAVAFILSSHRSEASWERYQKNIADARADLGDGVTAVDYCVEWFDHPLFIQCWAELIQAATVKMDAANRQTTPLIFTAHSLPMAMAARSPYVEQLQTTARMIAEKIGQQSWSLAFQSRSGRPSDPWLEPDIGDAIRKHAAEGRREVIVAPIGFVCDHVEVLYDLDIEAKNIADGLGLSWIRANCPNDHPTFIRMMADVISAQINADDDRE